MNSNAVKALKAIKITSRLNLRIRLSYTGGAVEIPHGKVARKLGRPRKGSLGNFEGDEFSRTMRLEVARYQAVAVMDTMTYASVAALPRSFTGSMEGAISPRGGRRRHLGVAAIISVVETCRRPVRDYLSSALWGSGDFPISRIPELTPAVLVTRS